MALSNKMAYDKITVSAIVEASGLSRATFYRHFKDKQDLTAWIFIFGCRMRDSRPNMEDPYLRTVDACGAIKENLVFYKKALMSESQNSLIEAMYEGFVRWFEKVIKSELKVDTLSEEMDFALRYHALALVYANRDWVAKGAPGTPEHRAHLICSSVPHILEPYIK